MAATRKGTDDADLKSLRFFFADAQRDRGIAGEYVEAMLSMLQQPEPDDYVVATGKTTSVREMYRITFAYVGLNAEGHLVVDPRFYRPADVDILRGNPAKAKARLGWTVKTTWNRSSMIDVDLARVKRAQH